MKHKKSSIEHSCASAWPNSKPHRLAGHHQVGRRKLYTARGTPLIGFLFPNHAPIVLLLSKTEPNRPQWGYTWQAGWGRRTECESAAVALLCFDCFWQTVWVETEIAGDNTTPADFFFFSFDFRYLWSKSKWDQREIFDDGSMKARFWSEAETCSLLWKRFSGTKRWVIIFCQIFTWRWKI